MRKSTFLFALPFLAFASHAAPAPGNFYVSLFGGAGSSDDFNVDQYGTAFYFEAAGGPLAVNAFGQVNHKSTGFWGLQLGYQTQDICLNFAQWALAPAVELEWFVTNRRTFDGDLSNNTARLPEHNFAVSYPMKRNVFLANAVLNFDHPCFPISPYLGFGIGGAVVRIKDADATQISPPEAGVNHYNANPSDTDSTFAGQIKLGLNYDYNACVSFFAEYRWLYLANTDFAFGSTVYPGHPETSGWRVNLDAQRYNLGSIGVRLNWS